MRKKQLLAPVKLAKKLEMSCRLRLQQKNEHLDIVLHNDEFALKWQVVQTGEDFCFELPYSAWVKTLKGIFYRTEIRVENQSLSTSYKDKTSRMDLSDVCLIPSKIPTSAPDRASSVLVDCSWMKGISVNEATIAQLNHAVIHKNYIWMIGASVMNGLLLPNELCEQPFLLDPNFLRMISDEAVSFGLENDGCNQWITAASGKWTLMHVVTPVHEPYLLGAFEHQYQRLSAKKPETIHLSDCMLDKTTEDWKNVSVHLEPFRQIVVCGKDFSQMMTVFADAWCYQDEHTWMIKKGSAIVLGSKDKEGL